MKRYIPVPTLRKNSLVALALAGSVPQKRPLKDTIRPFWALSARFGGPRATWGARAATLVKPNCHQAQFPRGPPLRCGAVVPSTRRRRPPAAGLRDEHRWEHRCRQSACAAATAAQSGWLEAEHTRAGDCAQQLLYGGLLRSVDSSLVVLVTRSGALAGCAQLEARVCRAGHTARQQAIGCVLLERLDRSPTCNGRPATSARPAIRAPCGAQEPIWRGKGALRGGLGAPSLRSYERVCAKTLRRTTRHDCPLGCPTLALLAP
eukprot:scaffold1200_cov383-Prasinococcus_capsulatus_cf.AAC.10